MFFVGHISLAFLIVYIISIRFPNVIKNISIPLIMLLSVTPDVDIILGLAGVDFGHRTLTHSIIISLIVGGIIIFLISLKYKRGLEATIYLIAYMSHLVIGDVLVEYINIIYPIGDFTIESTIESGSWQHISLETMLVGLMASVVVTKFRYRKDGSFPFGYYGIADSFLYSLLVIAMLVSVIYILNEFQVGLIYSLILVILHSASIATIALLWVGSKGAERQKHLVIRP